MLWSALFVLLFGRFGFSVCASVAVCIGGQVARLQPHLLLPLFTSNLDYEFKLFYSLEPSSNGTKPTIWSDPTYSFEPALKYMGLNSTNLREKLISVYSHSNNVELANLQYRLPRSAKQWSDSEFNGHLLTVIKYPEKVPEIVFNMYDKQYGCLQQILQFEQTNQIRIEYVLWGREDLHFYEPLNLTKLTNVLNGGNAAELGYKGDSSTSCQLITRSCLYYGGISLRGYFWKRDIALSVMQARFAFYREMMAQNKTTTIVEQFEKQMMEHYNITVCPIEVNYFPTVAVRHTKDDLFCIPPMEHMRKCYPAHMQEYVETHKCKKIIAKTAREASSIVTLKKKKGPGKKPTNELQHHNQHKENKNSKLSSGIRLLKNKC